MTEAIKKLSTHEFLADREDLAEWKIIALKYLEKASDVFWIEPKPKGQSKIYCEFDCGAYKGSEILTFSMKTISPMQIALKLSGLTSGHIFRFDEVDEAMTEVMRKRISVND